MTLQQLAQEALTLSSRDKAELAELLIESLGSEVDNQIEKAWIEEAVRRKDEVEQGAKKMIPEDEVRRRVRESLVK